MPCEPCARRLAREQAHTAGKLVVTPEGFRARGGGS